jgi:hypothetical protein
MVPEAPVVEFIEPVAFGFIVSVWAEGAAGVAGFVVLVCASAGAAAVEAMRTAAAARVPNVFFISNLPFFGCFRSAALGVCRAGSSLQCEPMEVGSEAVW